MARRRGDAWAILERRSLNQAEACEEIYPLRVVDDDLGALERLHDLLPARHLVVEPAEEDLTVPLERLSMLRRERGEAIDDVLGNDRRQPGVHRVMGISERMDVAHGAIDTDRRHVEDRQTAGDVDPPPGSPGDMGIIG